MSQDNLTFLKEICKLGKEIKLSIKNNNQSTEKATIV